MSRQRRQRSWTRLFLTSLLAGAGLAALRTLLKPAAPTVPAGVALPAVPIATKPSIALTKTTTVSESIPEPVPEPAAAEAAASVSAPAGEEPQLAFVPEVPAPAYAPPSAPTTSIWDPPVTTEWIPGFGTSQPASPDPWAAPGGAPPEPTDVPDLEPHGPIGRMRTGLKEWRHQTPRSQIVYTVIGGLCLLGAIIATVVILAL